MVLKVGNDDVSLGIESNASRSSQAFQIAAVIQPIKGESRNKMTVRTEELNAMVTRVGDQDLRLCVDRNSPRIHELRKFLAVGAELENEHASIGEDLNAVIIFVDDNDAIVLIRGYTSW